MHLACRFINTQKIREPLASVNGDGDGLTRAIWKEVHTTTGHGLALLSEQHVECIRNARALCQPSCRNWGNAGGGLALLTAWFHACAARGIIPSPYGFLSFGDRPGMSNTQELGKFKRDLLSP